MDSVEYKRRCDLFNFPLMTSNTVTISPKINLVLNFQFQKFNIYLLENKNLFQLVFLEK